MKYKLLQDIFLWENWKNDIDPKWYDKYWYKKDDIVEYNEWLNMFGKNGDTYKHRMFSKEFVEKRVDLFVKID